MPQRLLTLVPPMRDLVSATPFMYALVAQVPANLSSWERVGFLGTSIAVSIFIWKYWTTREREYRDEMARREDEFRAAMKVASDKASAENNRLLEDNNHKQDQIIELMRQQLCSRRHVMVDNDPSHPVPVHTTKNDQP